MTPRLFLVEHIKSKSGSSSTHDFTLRDPTTGRLQYALETETKHVQRVVEFGDDDKNNVLAKIEWRGNGRDLFQMSPGGDGDGKPVPAKGVWGVPVFGERYVETFTGADGKVYTWSKVVLGSGKQAVLEVHLTRMDISTPIAKYTSSNHPARNLPFGQPSSHQPSEHDYSLELAAGSEEAGEMLVVTFLIALGRAYAGNALTVRGFFRGAADTWTKNLLGM